MLGVGIERDFVPYGEAGPTKPPQADSSSFEELLQGLESHVAEPPPVVEEGVETDGVAGRVHLCVI